ncbi:hypothetical protein PX554_20155 [Sphingomonas sp. H39-1-10]|uniref:hypothetical protein n=1 Tax=Sphingomonas pollutisoli TaxID=3030829 RepID=UPI0023B920F5|nr:hypothetical protein [Sphingomonas pollutisoli]MDF0490447.1 hypothetical protein [Sphingomonas pollutisoli]
MGWQFKSAGSFADERAARDFAERNYLESGDVRTRNVGGRIELEIRQSALDGRHLQDCGEGRRNGWN